MSLSRLSTGPFVKPVGRSNVPTSEKYKLESAQSLCSKLLTSNGEPSVLPDHPDDHIDEGGHEGIGDDQQHSKVHVDLLSSVSPGS